MLLPSLVQVSELISGSVVPLAMFLLCQHFWWFSLPVHICPRTRRRHPQRSCRSAPWEEKQIQSISWLKYKIGRKGQTQDLHLLIGDIGEMASVGSFGRVLRVDVEVLEEDRLRERRLVVDPGASFPVGARTSLSIFISGWPVTQTFNHCVVLKIVLPWRRRSNWLCPSPSRKCSPSTQPSCWLTWRLLKFQSVMDDNI